MNFKLSWANTVFLLILSVNIAFSQNQTFTDPTTEFKQHAFSIGYSATDIANIVITDQYNSGGIFHTYINQAVDGTIIYHATSSVHQSNDKLLMSNIKFLHGLDRIKLKNTNVFDLKSSLLNLIEKRNYNRQANSVITNTNIDESTLKYKSPLISNNPILFKEVYFSTSKKTLNLAWQIFIDEVSTGNLMEFIIDKNTGDILQTTNLTISCFDNNHECNPSHPRENNNLSYNQPNIDNSYNVIAIPNHDPYDSGRTFETTPWDKNPDASPNGWHNDNGNDYTTTHGNNVDAYEDSDQSNSPTGGDMARADGGVELDFDFSWTSGGSPGGYKPAAITNLFYWNNTIHDVLYNYGFDEASGNFQEENYGAQGDATDYVRAEAQDGNGSCNANFSTPPDGSRPRMQMYLCGGKDSDFDNGVIIHEYGHGVSNRLTGGPTMTSCLSNAEQMGEGWSDFIAIMMTMLPGDQGTDPVAIGNWFFNYGATGGGIRPHPYSTDTTVNPMTYETISTVSIPHGVGSVWATMLWDLNWVFIDSYGWDEDIYNGSGGNNTVLRLVMEGMKIQPCSPGFVDGRNAILSADELLNNGINKDLIWQAFAARGLGYSAEQGSSYIVGDEVEAFDLPPDHGINMVKTADKYEVVLGDTITYYINLHNPSESDINNIELYDPIADSTYFTSGNYGAFLENDTVKWPLFNLLTGESKQYEFRVWIDTLLDNNINDFSDDMESSTDLWTESDYGSTSWNIQSSVANSGTDAWFANDGSSPGIANLDIAIPVGITNQSELSFFHSYNTETEWDGGLVFISTDNGQSWVDLGPYFTMNGYNDIIYFFKPGFSGNSGGFIESKVNLNVFAGQEAIIRFQMNCDQAVGGNGWYVDDVMINKLTKYVPNTVYLTDSIIYAYDRLDYPIVIAKELDLNFIVDNKCGTSHRVTGKVIIENSTGPFTYSWSTGDTLNHVDTLSVGTYYVTVSDGITESTDSIHILSLPTQVGTIDDYKINSLRSVIVNTCPNDTVFFDPSLTNDTLILNEQITLHKSITIWGPGKDLLSIDIDYRDRIFLTKDTVNINMTGFEIKNSQKAPLGGAVLNQGNLILENIRLKNNMEGTKKTPITNKGNLDIIDEVDIK